MNQYTKQKEDSIPEARGNPERHQSLEEKDVLMFFIQSAARMTLRFYELSLLRSSIQRHCFQMLFLFVCFAFYEKRVNKCLGIMPKSGPFLIFQHSASLMHHKTGPHSNFLGGIF